MAVAVTPDGRIITGGADGTVRIWDPVSGTLLATLVGWPGGWAVLLPDGSYKLGGEHPGLWWAAGLCRFEPGELDPYLPHIRRLDPDAPIFDDRLDAR
jgi:WD40 repeat protein